MAPKVMNGLDHSRAAQYVRMSTEHQRYSIDNQKAAIAEYAAARGVEVVATYADPGRSGLTLKKRPGLRQLLRDVLAGEGRFGTLLIYDISRWGRFQDTDESAYYEFLLRQTGLRVAYCAEPFENDGTSYSSLVKGLRRVMAGEQSRDMSTKIRASRRRVAAQGHWLGAQVGLGLRRIAVSADGLVRGELAEGQRKWAQSDHVELALGPPEEVAYVQRVFDLYVNRRWRQDRIANWLTTKGVRRPYDRPWNQEAVGRMLVNEAYVGTIATEKYEAVLGKEPIPRPREKWRRVENALPAIIDPPLFERAGELNRLRNRRLSEAVVLDALRDLWRREGRLTQALVNSDPLTPSPRVYANRFGGLLQAYDLIGYVPDREYDFIEARRKSVTHWSVWLRGEAARELEAAGATISTYRRGRLLLEGGYQVGLSVVVKTTPKPPKRPYWFLGNKAAKVPDARVYVRLDEGRLFDLLIVPKAALIFSNACVSRELQQPLAHYRFHTLAGLPAAVFGST